MSSIIVSENFKTLWKSGAQRQVDAMAQFMREVSLPPQIPEQEPMPEELDEIIGAISPFGYTGLATPAAIGLTLASHAAVLGVRPEAMHPLHYLSGTNEVEVAGRTTLLHFSERVGMPIINTAAFPIPISSAGRTQSLPETWRNRILFMSYDAILMDFRRFTTPEEREQCVSSEGQVAAPYRAANEGWLINQRGVMMKYTGCYRLPTPSELDAYFTSIPEGTVFRFSPYSAGDFFSSYGIRARDLETVMYRDAVPATATDPQPGASTNVPAQDFSGEPRRPNARRNPNSNRLSAASINPLAGSPRPRNQASRMVFRPNASEAPSVVPVVHDEILSEPPPEIPSRFFYAEPSQPNISFGNEARISSGSVSEQIIRDLGTVRPEPPPMPPERPITANNTW